MTEYTIWDWIRQDDTLWSMDTIPTWDDVFRALGDRPRLDMDIDMSETVRAHRRVSRHIHVLMQDLTTIRSDIRTAIRQDDRHGERKARHALHALVEAHRGFIQNHWTVFSPVVPASDVGL